MIWLALAATVTAQDSPPPKPMLDYPQRVALATYRHDAMNLADGCEHEARARKLETDVCERWRGAAVGYLRQSADLYVWCSATILAETSEPTVPFDCPITGDTNRDPVVIRYNEIAPLISLPQARF